MAFAAGALLVTVFIGKVSEALRQREQQVLALQDKLARQERLGSVATLAAGAAHELGTPLATIAVLSKDLELLAAGNAEMESDARLVRAEVERCREVLRSMSSRSAELPGEAAARIDLAALLDSVGAAFSAELREAVRTEVAGPLREARLPADAARQALSALVRNGLGRIRSGAGSRAARRDRAGVPALHRARPRRRHVAGDAEPRVGAVLHHQGTGAGHGLGDLPGPCLCAADGGQPLLRIPTRRRNPRHSGNTPP